MTTWQDIFGIIHDSFGITQRLIAKRLNVSPSLINKIKSGTANPTIDNEDLFNASFKKGFMRSNQTNPPNEKTLLSHVKGTIEESYGWVMQDMHNIGCWDETDYKKFVMHLLNLAPSKKMKTSTPATTTESPQSKSSLESIRKKFIQLIKFYHVEDIIERKPAALNRMDSVCLNIFLKETETMYYDSTAYSSQLASSIRLYYDSLLKMALTLEGTLNNRFGFDDETSSINMEDDEEYNLNRHVIPELTPELIIESANPHSLWWIYLEEWGNFRHQMAFLYKQIDSLQSES